MDREGRNEKVGNSWQFSKHARLYSDLPQAYKGKPLKPVVFQRGNLNFCVRSTSLLYDDDDDDDNEDNNDDEEDEELNSNKTTNKGGKVQF